MRAPWGWGDTGGGPIVATTAWPLRVTLALVLAVLVQAGCAARPAAPPPAASLLRGWSPPQHEVFDPLAPPGVTTASLGDLATYWRVDLGYWRLQPGSWRRVGVVGGPPPAGGWSWAAASLAARASGFGWPGSGAALYRARVSLAGDPGWPVRPADITLWAAVRGGTVAAGWLTFRAGGRALVTVYDQGPTVFTLPYWSAVHVALTRAQAAALPAGAFVTAAAPVGGAIRGARAVTFAEGMAAVEGLLIPGRAAGTWRYVGLGPVGSALASPPQPEWGDVTGQGGTDLTVYFGSGAARGLAIYAIRHDAGAWRAIRLFAGAGDLATDVPAPGRGRIVVLGTWDSSHRSVAYQTVVWRDGRFRLGPGIDAPAPPGILGSSRARSAGAAPDVRGLPLRRALRRLAARGLGALPLVPAVSADRTGTVLWQDPPPGGSVGAWPWLGLEVAAGLGRLRAGPPPRIAQLRVEDGAGTRSAGAAALGRWRQEAAWALNGPLPVMPVVRGPGQISGGADGWILVARLARPWGMTVPAASGAGMRRAAVDTLAYSDAPLYAGWVLLGAGGSWVAAARLPASRNRALRALLARLAP